MGLIKTAIQSIKGTLDDQALSAVQCEDMGNDLLMAKKTNPNGILRNGSRIVVNPAQVAVIIDNGRVLDASAEPGIYEFQSDASPSFFAGNFGGMFREMWTRFVFGGATYQDQAVYYINTREIINNGFGTPTPIMYRDWEHCMADARRPNASVPMRVGIRCAGNYTFLIDQPWAFLKRIGGTAALYYKDELLEQMRIEIVSTFQAMLNSLCDEQNQVYPMDLPAKSFYIKELMDQQVYDAPIRERGMRVAGFNLYSVTLDEESKRKIDEFEASGDFATQQARMVNVMGEAARNDAGAGVGFLNLNMMNSAAGGMVPGGVVQGAAAQQQMQPAPATPAAPGTAGVSCPACGELLAGKFCANCGAAAPTPANHFCSNCGAKGSGKFCSACGTPMA